MRSRTLQFAEQMAALVILLCVLPLMMILGFAILLDTGRPIFFTQRRMGQSGKPFKLHKLRTMIMDCEAGSSVTAGGDRRITHTGLLLRKYKLDELPQLWNVAKGEMQFIGPRPEVPKFVDCADPLWQSALSVKPGITDLSTLFYRNEEELLRNDPEPERTYRELILPRKLMITTHYLSQRTWRSDFQLLRMTMESVLFPARHSELRLAQCFALPAHIHDQQL